MPGPGGGGTAEAGVQNTQASVQTLVYLSEHRHPCGADQRRSSCPSFLLWVLSFVRVVGGEEGPQERGAVLHLDFLSFPLDETPPVQGVMDPFYLSGIIFVFTELSVLVP